MKTDQGFEWIYWKLSYRRKFIRTLWAIPLALLISVIICYRYDSLFIKVALISFLFIIVAIQLMYNYKHHKKEVVKTDNL